MFEQNVFWGSQHLSTYSNSAMKRQKTTCEICSKLTVKTLFFVFIVNFEHISHIVLVPLLTLNHAVYMIVQIWEITKQKRNLCGCFLCCPTIFPIKAL